MPSLFESAVMEIPLADESCDSHATHRCTHDRTPSIVDWQVKASGIPADHADMGWWRCCRGILRRRPRSVRRRMLLWLATLTFIAGFLYLDSRGLDTLSQIPQRPVAEPRREVEEAAVRQPKAVMDDDGVDDPDMDLRPDLAPATLHYVWCGKRVFQYQHYLALRSANRAIKPDKLIFHYEFLPEMDTEGYYTWYNQTLMDIDHILPRPLNYSSCPLSGPQRYLMVFDILDKLGGIYVPEDALLVDFPVHLRTSSLVSGVIATDPETYKDGIIVAKREGFKKPTDTEELLVVLSLGREEHGGIRPCASEDNYATDESGTIICVNVRRELFPRDIWESGSRLSSLARAVAYGVQTIQSRQDERTPMPRIGHVVCISCEMRFITYLSILSALHVAGLNKVYVHGVEEPRGQWWEKLKMEPRVRYVRREYPEAFYDRAVMTPSLATGVMRVAILLKYGGVYMDQNVVWTRRIPDVLYSYDAVISPDWHLYGAWPESINHGAVLAKRGCEYMSRLRSVLQRYKSNPFWFNDHYMSYKILERRPHLAVLDRHLQVKCVNHNCHPTWQPNYRSGLMQNRPGAPFNWQNETLSIHWHDSFPELDPDMIKYTSGLIVQASRNVLFNAGVDLNKL